MKTRLRYDFRIKTCMNWGNEWCNLLGVYNTAKTISKQISKVINQAYFFYHKTVTVNCVKSEFVMLLLQVITCIQEGSNCRTNKF